MKKLKSPFICYCHLCGETTAHNSHILCEYCLESLKKAYVPKTLYREGLSSSFLDFVGFYDYHSHYIRNLAIRIKFQNQKTLLLELLKSIPDFSFLPPIQEVWYVPLSLRKFLERGFNPPFIIARFLSKKLNLPLKKGLKKKDGISQSSKTRAERLKIIEKHTFTFSLLKRKPTKDIQHILLVDDILTTGSTLFTNAMIIKERAKNEKLKITAFGLFHSEVENPTTKDYVYKKKQ